MTSGIVYEGKHASISLEEQERFESSQSLPGDKVRPIPSEKAGASIIDVHAQLLNAMHGLDTDILTVKSLIVCKHGKVNHEFEEIEGRWNAGLFEDARGLVNHYGSVVLHADGLWLVPFKRGIEAPRADMAQSPLLLASTMDRCATYQCGSSEAQQLANATGEFVVAPASDGKWTVVGVPWMGEASEEEANEAAEAIEMWQATTEPHSPL